MKHSSGFSRRDLLINAAWTAAALAASPRLVLAGDAQAAAPPAAKRKVIVVGAGLAGLSAAYELVRSGHDVTVLEANNYPGGRVRTLREGFADGLRAEAGAMDYGDGFRHVVHYVKEFGLTGTIPPRPRGKVVVIANGNRTELTPGQKLVWPIQMTAEEERTGIGELFERYIHAHGAKLGDPTRPDFKLEPWAELDTMTFSEFLRRQGLSNEAIQLMSILATYGYGWDSGSALHRLVSDVALSLPGGIGVARFIEGGSDQLPNAFAKFLRERIWYSAPVTRILQEPDGVRVVFKQLGEEKSMTADRVVCAATLPAMRRIEFSPELPAAKRQIMSQLEWTPITRIFLQTRRRYWAEQGFASQAGTNLPVQLVQEHPVLRAEDQTRGILECFIRGPEAKRIGDMDEDAQIALAIENVEKVYPGIKDHVERGVSYSWHEDPYIGGGFAWWKPNEFTRWLPETAKAEGRIHFAGDHTSIFSRTQEGALESGNRVAREINQLASGPEGKS